LKRPVPSQSALEAYIGPPLRTTFATLLESTDAELLETAVGLYRERFSTTGLYENELYAGVPLMLERLQAGGRSLFVATSKVGLFAERILAHFQLSQFFKGVYGSTLAGLFDDKTDLLRHLLESESLEQSETVMVGDRKHDVIAARNHRLLALGVTYGYGTREELMRAGAHAFCDSPAEVADFLLQH
jgi:phosphoglycolate phosphatase